jgi:putative membrane protein
MVGLLIRLVISAFVLMFVDFVLPGFNVGGFGGAFLAAIAIAILGYVANIVLGKRKSRQSKGIVGFFIAVIVIYAAQYFVQAMSVTAWGAVLAAVLIGIIDIFLPTALGR